MKYSIVTNIRVLLGYILVYSNEVVGLAHNITIVILLHISSLCRYTYNVILYYRVCVLISYSH